ncbi:MAG: hypothetical protein WD965_07640, partial [Actinomycetota bacterium]
MRRLKLPAGLAARVATGIGVLTLCLSAIAVAGAAGREPSGQRLTGCVSTTTGEVFIVKPTAECRKGEFRVEWQLVDLAGDRLPSGVLGAGLQNDPAVGPTGPAGVDGTNGTDGTDGIDGVNGTDGVNGIDGVNGTDGADGDDGSNGSDGVDGADGADGT